ncbi:hypothetical protein F4859DRAFT_452592 [Xylaria cf. heliscus]|nr:hypothetical protein F4859DRAFT_452592 [Xylaria cf. heliscus]
MHNSLNQKFLAHTTFNKLDKHNAMKASFSLKYPIKTKSLILVAQVLRFEPSRFVEKQCLILTTIGAHDPGNRAYEDRNAIRPLPLNPTLTRCQCATRLVLRYTAQYTWLHLPTYLNLSRIPTARKSDPRHICRLTYPPLHPTTPEVPNYNTKYRRTNRRLIKSCPCHTPYYVCIRIALLRGATMRAAAVPLNLHCIPHPPIYLEQSQEVEVDTSQHQCTSPLTYL